MSGSWRRIRAVAGKDLLETRRDRLAPIFSLIMPLVFTAFFGLLFGGSQKLPVYVIDQDGGAAAKQLVAGLRKSDVIKVSTEADQADAEKAVNEYKAAAAVIVPAGFSEEVASGKPATLTVVQTSQSSGAQSAQEEVRAVASDMMVQEQAAEAAATASGAELASAQRAVAAALSKPAASVTIVEAGTSEGDIPSGFVLSAPGMLIQFILFGLTSAAGAFIVERRTGTLLRLFTTRISGAQLLVGKLLGMFIVCYVQAWLIVVFGQLIFDVNYFRDPLGLFLVVTALCVMVSCMGLLLATLFKSEQALTSGAVLMSMVVSAMSGAWFPLEVTGATFSRIGHALPTAWVIDALRGIVVQDWTVMDVLPTVGYTAVWAVVLFGLAVWRFRGVAREA